MPTVLYIMGWRFFYANEGNEPIHIHCRKAEKECKYWLDTDNFDVEKAYSRNQRISHGFSLIDTDKAKRQNNLGQND